MILNLIKFEWTFLLYIIDLDSDVNLNNLNKYIISNFVISSNTYRFNLEM